MGRAGKPAVGDTGVYDTLMRLDETVYIVRGPYGLGAAAGGTLTGDGPHEVVAAAPPLAPNASAAPGSSPTTASSTRT